MPGDDVELDARTRAWVEGCWGREVVATAPLSGGFTSTMLRVEAGDGEAAVLRLMTKEPWRRHAPGLLTRERDVQRLLGATSVPVPTSLGLDADGDEACDPAHLMTLLPGRTELGRCDDDLLDALWQLAGSVHAVDPGPTRRPRDYQSWAHEAKRVVPPWSTRDALWRRAFRLLEPEPPAFEPSFLHRDLHLGNVLWHEGQVSGVVDWVETSWGPAELDVAHATTYLALLHGPDVAERFLERRPGRSTRGAASVLPGPHLLHWHVMDVVGQLPDPVKLTEPWRHRGVVVTDATAYARLEEWLARLLG
jgi:aminoglycoside phosphotransferase (APT) family kinase protein